MSENIISEEKRAGYEKALNIYKLMVGFKEYRKTQIIYNSYGIIDFRITFPLEVDCKIKPNDDNTFDLRFYKTFNEKQYSILAEKKGIHADDLYSVFGETFYFLKDEYKKFGQRSWWGYTEILSH